MLTRKLGKRGPEFTVIGLGAWAMGGPGWSGSWGPQDDDDSVATVQRAIDAGINWIDTAEVYGLGHSEEVVGRGIKGRRDEVFVATKCVRRFENGEPMTSGDPKLVIQDCEASLKRLGVEYFDLYQVHHPPQDFPIEETWGALVELADAGKTRFIGVSNLPVDWIEKCEKIRHVDSVQPSYNLLGRDIEQDLLPFCLENGIGVITYGPLSQGLLSGTFDPSRLKGDDWRRNEGFMGKVPAGMEVAEKLRPLAERYGFTVGQLAIAWVLSHPAVTSAIVGARRPEQIDENVVAGRGPIPDDLRASVEEALATD